MRETLRFLTELAVNNNKVWFDEHRAWYQECRDKFVAFAEEYIRRLSEIDPTLKGLQPKDCIWRINRDIRFSLDKRPYKEWFGCFPAAGVPGQPKTWGKKSMRGGYYVHIQPGQCMFAGGIWDPSKELLTALRKEIEANYEEVEEIMGAKAWKKYFDQELVLMITLQNLMPWGITKLMHVDPLLGIAAGSVSMTGGHGTAGGFAGILEQMGLQGAGTIGMAAATFGLIAGSMVGGPLANRIIRTKLTQEQMQPQDITIDPAMAGIESDEASPAGRAERMSTNEQEFQQYAKASYWILIAMGGGTLLSWALALTGVTFPTYFGALILAAILRNTIEFIPYKKDGKWTKADKQFDMERITSVGNICLSMFLGMAMISLRLWELASLALPLVVILTAQVIMMVVFVYFLAFPVLGRTYDAAVLCAGLCGFGLGATPNAMANMSAVCYKYHYSPTPFLIVPIIGSMFTDIINTGIISLFLKFL